MQKATFTGKLYTVFTVVIFILFVTLIQSCKKSDPGSMQHPVSESEEFAGKRKPQNPPAPQPQPFYFSNCGNPVINGKFEAGQPTNATITMTYVNSPGGSHAGFTSATVNGITLTAPAGTLNVGTGTIVFTASGTPVSSGIQNIHVSIANSISCPLYIVVTNAPATGGTVDPGPAFGSTGTVNFIYKGQSVTYRTVRAEDGKIWLQQNLGSPQVAYNETDQASFGDLFQWGRWDDGHQARNSTAITGGSSFANPSNIPSGNPNFIKGSTSATRWWAAGSASDTWSGTVLSSTNGKDPCTALGTGWRLPSAAEWENVLFHEDLSGTIAAFQSNLMLPSSGYRYSVDGSVYPNNGDFGYYWTSTAGANGTAKVFFFDNVYNATVTTADRGNGFSCRCVKD